MAKPGFVWVGSKNSGDLAQVTISGFKLPKSDHPNLNFLKAPSDDSN